MKRARLATVYGTMVLLNMLREIYFNFSLKKKLIVIMLFLSFILVSFLLFIYSQAEKSFFNEIERQTKELTQAIQIGVREVTTSGATDEARLKQYLTELNAKGVKEISIISNKDEVVASTNPAKIGQPLPTKKKDLIIKAELGEPVSGEGKAYNVILPVIAGDAQYGYIHLKINMEDFSRQLKINTLKRIAATIFVFGAGIIIILILARRYTDPIQNVVDAATRVAAGDLKQHIQVNSRDEIGQLSESFNFMVQKLKENRLLEEKLREAEHLSGLGQLSRSMAHEIRNPLNFISLSVDHIGSKYKPYNSEDQKKFSEMISGIKQEIHRLNNLVNDFLDYGRPIKLNIRQVRVNDLLEDVTGLIWAKAEADGINIIKDYSADVNVNVDPDLFKSCLLNVITNAVHAMETSQNGSDREKILKIKTDAVDSKFILSIADNGEGVPPDNLERIFEPFFSTKLNGLGLGLPMTRRVIEEHGGKVEFYSAEGSGSEVRLILPVTG